MVYTPHQPIKAEKLVNTYVGLLPQYSLLHKLFVRKGIADYADAKDDTISFKVEGRLPARRYAFRNDRSTEIVFDQYKERKISVTLGDHIYSAVEITDEQVDFDSTNPQSLLPRQASAVGEGINHLCAGVVESAPYPVVIGGAQYNIRKALLEARKVMNKLRVPGQRFVVVGSDFEQAILEDEKLSFASVVGDDRAASVLANATLGQLFGMNFVRDDTIDPEAAYVFVDGAFVLANGAPTVPSSVGFGASASYDGIALTWLRQYDLRRFQDQSVVHTWAGTQLVKDVFLNWSATPGIGGEVVSESEHFVRGIKLTLGGTSTGPTAGTDLADDTGLVDADIWEGTAPTP